MIIDMRAVDEKLRQFEFTCEHRIDLWDKYEHETHSDKYETTETKMIRWLRENINGHAMYNHNFVFRFEKQEDLVAFKLMWG